MRGVCHGSGGRAVRGAGRVGGLALAAALLLPGVASAHIHSGVVGVSERATIASVPAGVSARVDRSDLALRVAVAGGHTVVVPGRAIRVAGGGSATWHDARVRRPGRRAVPVVVDGRPAALTGRTVSALPADLARLVVVLALVTGAATLACAAGCLLHDDLRARPAQPARPDSFWSLGE